MKTLIAIILLFFPQPVEAVKVSKKDINCMAHAVYHEARGEPEIGKYAVAHVVLNRKQSGQFQSSICGVVYQPHQFTNIKLTKPKYGSPAWKDALAVSTYTLSGMSKDPTRGAKYFYAHKVVRPSWSESKAKIKLGNHSFL